MAKLRTVSECKIWVEQTWSFYSHIRNTPSRRQCGKTRLVPLLVRRQGFAKVAAKISARKEKNNTQRGRERARRKKLRLTPPSILSERARSHWSLDLALVGLLRLLPGALPLRFVRTRQQRGDYWQFKIITRHQIVSRWQLLANGWASFSWPLSPSDTVGSMLLLFSLQEKEVFLTRKNSARGMRRRLP